MSSANIVGHLERLETVLSERLDRVERQLINSRETFGFFHVALSAYRQHAAQEQPIAQPPVVKWLGLIQRDTELRFPHRKILECLLRHYDYSTSAFQELHAAKLCRESRVGKGRFKGYMLLLVSKGYIEERGDGYRKFYRVRAGLPSP